MDRINFRCHLGGQDVELQLDRKAMPGEAGPCYMITANGCFKGYISQQKNKTFQSLGASYFTKEEIVSIANHLSKY